MAMIHGIEELEFAFWFMKLAEIRATGTYFHQATNDVIYFSFKNNTRIYFSSIKNDINVNESKMCAREK